MVKRLAVFMTWLTVLVFIAGCTSGKPDIKPPKDEPNDIEPTKAEPNEVKPTKTEPNEVDPTKAEPNEVEPTKTEPPETKPPKVERPKPKPPKPKPLTKVSFHDKCARILNNFVNDKGMVNYKKLRYKRSDLNKL
ncbi:unnamed protein product, partial [marine sediment metagenome]